MDIRAETEADHAAVRALHLAAFGDHGPLVADLVDALRVSLVTRAGQSLVAVEGGAVVGHVMFTPALLDAPRRLVEVQVLSPLSVLPPRQRDGIGSRLVTEDVGQLARTGVPVVFVEGSPDYYGRLGFRAGGGLNFRRPSLRIPERAFQAALLPAHAPWMTGTLVYPDVFWTHDAVGLRTLADD